MRRLFHKPTTPMNAATVVLAGATVILYIAGVNLTAVLTGVGIGGPRQGWAVAAAR